jgi:hypothetical protein
MLESVAIFVNAAYSACTFDVDARELKVRMEGG